MLHDPLTQVLALLLAAVLVVGLARRVGLPPVLGYLVVGVLVGPHVLGVLDDPGRTQLLAEIGVVFLLFTLGLEFSWPRMVAMRREVFGLGLLQVLLTMALFVGIGRWLGLSWLVSVVTGGALSMSSTAIVVRQLSEQSELNRTHGRLTFAILLFQDLAFVPLLALASALAEGTPAHFEVGAVARAVASGFAALLIVLLAGRYLLRPLFVEIAESRLRELFTLAVLFVVLAAAWITEHAGLSLALGGFLAGMLLAETEYRHQVEAVIRPFRELLLGLFFISVGMLLDVQLLAQQFWLIFATLLGLVLLKVLAATLAVRGFVSSNFKALRTALLQGGGGEFGVALLTLLIKAPNSVAPNRIVQPLLLALVVSMLAAPFGIRYNKTVARLLLRERGPPLRSVEREDAATREVARREHVILCGYGRVGQSIARVLESQGFEYIAVDLDVRKVASARQAGHAVIFGDSSDEELLEGCGLATASALVVSFADTAAATSIVRAVRRLRGDVPVLVRTADEGGIEELRGVGATEVVPETFEASLMLAAQVLALLNVPNPRVIATMEEIRRARYVTLRGTLLPYTPGGAVEGEGGEEGISSIVIPPLAWAVGRTLEEVRSRGAEVAFTALRRQGITGREPQAATVLKGGDVLVVYGQPRAIEHAEAILLAG
ncbi:MAG TPA: monovalent cation:proton antiporter-2 (CPA2) family protein [Steroidobacteraceae bacterium]|nr:monovalent cation:proton antiporter-2 (CPA2) family protein [Steroidobacteraceae bacterium]